MQQKRSLASSTYCVLKVLCKCQVVSPSQKPHSATAPQRCHILLRPVYSARRVVNALHSPFGTRICLILFNQLFSSFLVVIVAVVSCLFGPRNSFSPITAMHIRVNGGTRSGLGSPSPCCGRFRARGTRFLHQNPLYRNEFSSRAFSCAYY